MFRWNTYWYCRKKQQDRPRVHGGDWGICRLNKEKNHKEVESNAARSHKPKNVLPAIKPRPSVPPQPAVRRNHSIHRLRKRYVRGKKRKKKSKKEHHNGSLLMVRQSGGERKARDQGYTSKMATRNQQGNVMIVSLRRATRCRAA